MMARNQVVDVHAGPGDDHAGRIAAATGPSPRGDGPLFVNRDRGRYYNRQPDRASLPTLVMSFGEEIGSRWYRLSLCIY